MRALAILALVLLSSCASLKESWTGPRYRQIHTPGDDGARRDGRVEVLLSVDKSMLIAPAQVVFTARFHGDMDDCREVRWLYADGDSSSGQDCARAATKLHFMKDEGATVVTVLGDGDHVIGRGAVTVRIGGEAE